LDSSPLNPSTFQKQKRRRKINKLHWENSQANKQQITFPIHYFQCCTWPETPKTHQKKKTQGDSPVVCVPHPLHQHPFPHWYPIETGITYMEELVKNWGNQITCSNERGKKRHLWKKDECMTS
jgi:hypothetical protein